MFLQRVAVGAVRSFRFRVSLAVPVPFGVVGVFREGGQATDIASPLLFTMVARLTELPGGRPRFLVDDAVSAIIFVHSRWDSAATVFPFMYGFGISIFSNKAHAFDSQSGGPLYSHLGSRGFTSITTKNTYN